MSEGQREVRGQAIGMSGGREYQMARAKQKHKPEAGASSVYSNSKKAPGRGTMCTFPKYVRKYTRGPPFFARNLPEK